MNTCFRKKTLWYCAFHISWPMKIGNLTIWSTSFGSLLSLIDQLLCTFLGGDHSGSRLTRSVQTFCLHPHIPAHSVKSPNSLKLTVRYNLFTRSFVYRVVSVQWDVLDIFLGHRLRTILVRCPDHVNWLLSIRSSSSSTLRLSLIVELLTLSQSRLSSPMVVSHFNHLCSVPYFFTQYPQLVTIGDDSLTSTQSFISKLNSCTDWYSVDNIASLFLFTMIV